MTVFLIIVFTVFGHGDQEFMQFELADDLPACWRTAAQKADEMLKEREQIGLSILRIGCEIQLPSPV